METNHSGQKLIRAGVHLCEPGKAHFRENAENRQIVTRAEEPTTINNVSLLAKTSGHWWVVATHRFILRKTDVLELSTQWDSGRVSTASAERDTLLVRSYYMFAGFVESAFSLLIWTFTQ